GDARGVRRGELHDRITQRGDVPQRAVAGQVREVGAPPGRSGLDLQLTRGGRAVLGRVGDDRLRLTPAGGAGEGIAHRRPHASTLTSRGGFSPLDPPTGPVSWPAEAAGVAPGAGLTEQQVLLSMLSGRRAPRRGQATHAVLGQVWLTRWTRANTRSDLG